MNYPRIYERVYCQPLALTGSRFAAIHAVLFPRLSAGGDNGMDALTMVAGDEDYRENKSRYTGKRAQRCGPAMWADGTIDANFFGVGKAGVAVIPIYGVLAKNLSSYEEACGGGTDTNPISHAVAQATEAAGIEAIVLDLDTPGGEARGIPELAARIRSASAIKPVYAFTDASCYSAGYWLASQATEIHATRSAGLGSIGVRAGWLDTTVALQLSGLKLETFSAGKHKAAGAPFRGLTDEEREMIQEQVNECYGQFTADVVEARPWVEQESMEGQTFTCRQALDRGLVDGEVEDWETFLAAI